MVRLMLRLGLALSSLLAAAAPAGAQPAEGVGVKQEGDYGGVKPGAGPTTAPSAGKSRRPPARKSLLWIGFTPKADGASELFFQAVDPFTVSQRLEGQTLVVVLEGLKGQARNTRRPLDTRFFETSLARVTARKVTARRARKGVAARAAGIEVRIAFKDARDAREGAVRTETGDDKMFYAYLGFAATSPPSPAAAADGGSTLQDPE